MKKNHTLRIGLGRDIHRLIAGRPLILGGIRLPFDKGEAGHSDGDVLCHAIIDALLGAAALGDIGELFPDTNPLYKDASSIELLRTAWNMVQQKMPSSIINLDCVITLEKPAILPYKQQIRERLAAALEISVDAVYLKGKTAEGLGVVGQGEAVEAWAVALLEK
ncbi:MAG: 2-C-methyl-D-erythritol 2,4-cyclodiphosphate synthase [Spirochaetaceae bacterium]|jgi:2-C-methyl-D-erythritol 2,4-cyclodiphosphate synthase/2-C-methyl-D-erythritol 4-phosphate cytidylyltransferase/2-C-methyl-D-erythritol 2,4-cyclodiphosphate synthase|nr:2-C-methyl-D-erythritol 2,4-cyclodiphosphate synthase [Spirochaetaceae bacterium]